MEFVMGLVTGYLLNWIALSALVLVAIFCEAMESTGFALFFAVIAGFVAYLFFQVPPQHVLYGAIGYVLIGVVWSIWRYRRFVRDAVDNNPGRESYAHLSPARQAGRIVHWMIVWPISMASNVIGDVLLLAKTIVTTWLRGIYESIYQEAVQSAKKP
jgi:membrane protein implicated in regulation of membrane protease activity